MFFSLQCAAGNTAEHVPEIELYLETLFSLLDGLRTWLRQQQQDADAAAAAAAGTSTGQSLARGSSSGRGSSASDSGNSTNLPPEAVNVDALLKEIPKEMMATAAFR